MADRRSSTHSPFRDLHVCDACGRPFVAPVSVVETLDGEHHVVELSCTNCGWSDIGVHRDADLIALDRQLDRATSQIAATADGLALAFELERIECFARALDDGLILPEDF